MRDLLQGKVAVVTGASKGIGRSIAFELASVGAKIVLAARGEKDLEGATAAIRSSGGECLPVATDVSSETQVQLLVERTMEKFGRIDILINNAGFGKFSKVVDTEVGDFDGMMAVNLRGVFLMCKAVLPQMIAQRKGDIINIASLAGKNSFVGGATYSATKWGLIGFSRSLMLEVREFNIRVVSVCPGSVNTSFSDHSRDAEKIIQPQDVAETVLFALTMPGRSNVSEIDIRPTIVPRKA
ncbi:MAG TPA: SDR family NAD(P)-dependent oxidoreductase [Bacteroidota bacterium]|nr:SDR family NAD(P)-dependent oxidoreductase [Bacteroidota bacterium]